MLYIVLALVLAAFGLLIAALTTANTLWAWISVTISVVAAGLLIADWVTTRRKRDAAVPARTPAERNVALSRSSATSGELPAVTGALPPLERPPEPVVPVVAPDAGAEARPAEQTVRTAAVAAPPPPDEEPAEESTDAADLLIVSELDTEVRVVDERPRYHLDSCGWLRARPTLPLPVNEARELGFTPCSYCGPDAILAARQRARR